MPKIINVEKNTYLQENIKRFTSNKVNQYSKFLDQTPLFITYLSVNEILTRNDVGTGGIDADIGPNSPVRFNQINGLPAFNIPALKPEAMFDENGYDIDIEINDVSVPPNTVKPKPGDYLIIYIPNSIEVAFRVNAFNYNTIQSNDFYTFNADLKYTGKDLLKRFEPQIVEVYETIFDNIGTQEKCFIRSTDLDKVKALGSLINELLDLYKINFYDADTGTFVSKNNTENVDSNASNAWYYDKYVSKFIMDSEIYFDQNSNDTIALAPEDITEQSELWYRQTLQYAVLKKDTALLGRFPYAYQVGIQMKNSIFVLYDIMCRTAYLHITNYKLYEGHSDGLDSSYLYEYFPHAVIHEILDNDPYNYKEIDKYNPHDCWNQHLQNEGEADHNEDQPNQDASFKYGRDEKITSAKLKDIEIQRTFREGSCDVPFSKCGDIGRIGKSKNSAHNPPIDNSPTEKPYQFTYLDEIVISYLLNRKLNIARENLIPYALQRSNYVYKMMPMIIFIVFDYYNSYFKEEKVSDL